MGEYKYMVLVKCITYNHAKYIKDAMNGFCMQETTFPFVCTIIDDASTDGEPEVIEKYLEEHFDLANGDVVRKEETDNYVLTFAQHKTNKNCYFAVLYLKYNHYSIKKDKTPYLAEWINAAKYVALCEGDDYWIDSKKLQKQAAFMESHPDHSMCFCAYEKHYPDNKSIFVPRYEHNKEECPIEDVIFGGGGFSATNAMFYRASNYVSYTNWIDNAVVGDLPMTLTLAVNGKIGYLSDLMCVYRYSASGSWSQKMSSDFKFRRKNYKGVKTILKRFDIWTKRKYHKTVKKKILMNQKENLVCELRHLKFFFQNIFKHVS